MTSLHARQFGVDKVGEGLGEIVERLRTPIRSIQQLDTQISARTLRRLTFGITSTSNGPKSSVRKVSVGVWSPESRDQFSASSGHKQTACLALILVIPPTVASFPRRTLGDGRHGCWDRKTVDALHLRARPRRSGTKSFAFLIDPLPVYRGNRGAGVFD